MREQISVVVRCLVCGDGLQQQEETSTVCTEGYHGKQALKVYFRTSQRFG